MFTSQRVRLPYAGMRRKLSARRSSTFDRTIGEDVPEGPQCGSTEPSRPDLVLFDIDGTLVDHRAAARKAVGLWMKSIGARSHACGAEAASEWEQLEKVYFPQYLSGALSFQDQRRARVSAMLAWAQMGEPGDVDDTFNRYLAHYEAAWEPFDDVIDAFESLHRRNIRTGVFSNGQREQQLAKLSRVGLDGLVGVVVTSADVGASKPSAEAFKAACEALEAHPASTVYVGDDREVDVCGALGAGLQAVWIDRHDSQLEPPPGAPRIRTLQSLTDAIS